MTVAFLFTGMLPAQKSGINSMPVPGPDPAINIAKPKTFQLSNGLTVMVVENSKLPRITVSLSMDRPPLYEGNVTGVSQIMASQFKNGTKNISKEEFNKKIDFLGANLSFSPTGAFARSLSKHFPQVLSLMADAIINPKFSDKEIQISKERAIAGLQSNEKNASSIASRVSAAIMYGKNTSRGKFETVESINKIQVADIQTIYRKYYTPDNAYLVIVGDVKYDQIKPLIEKAFYAWEKSNTEFPNLEPADNPVKTEVNIIDVPNAVQSVIHIKNLHTLRMKDKDFFPAIIAQAILGDGSDTSSRLNMNLREKNRFTYVAGAILELSKYSSSFTSGADVRTDVTDKAVKELMKELNTIATVKPDELANAKEKLKGIFIMSLEDPETIAQFAITQKDQDLPLDFFNNYLKSIDKVTAVDVSNAVKTIILPNQSRIFITGKAVEISDGVENLGYAVNYFDKDANPVKK
ncbi:pitrilysin family protein [Chryseobacterium sp.]|uniref:M16 family metallopeptidase n=1 Tax=Chryseobacterium sp. TaxID=1871047 RepID=UPI0028A1069F|nr:pitrilysin family protein [Chryseobacterium sp.]